MSYETSARGRTKIKLHYSKENRQSITTGFSDWITLTSNKVDILEFVPSVTGSYVIYTYDNTGDPFLELWPDTQEWYTSNNDGHGNSNAEIKQTMHAGKKYYIEVHGYRAGAVTCRLNITY